MDVYEKAHAHVTRQLLGRAYRYLVKDESIPVDLYCDLCGLGIDPDSLDLENIPEMLKEKPPRG